CRVDAARESGEHHPVAPFFFYHGPWDCDRENVLAHGTVSRCHFSNRLYKPGGWVSKGRRPAPPLFEPETFFNRERGSNIEKAMKIPRLEDPVVHAEVVTRFSLQCPVFVMAVRYEADESPHTFLARRSAHTCA